MDIRKICVDTQIDSQLPVDVENGFTAEDDYRTNFTSKTVETVLLYTNMRCSNTYCELNLD